MMKNQKRLSNVISAIRNRSRLLNLLDLVTISATGYGIMMLLYWLADNYDSVRWYIAFYLALYFMLMSTFICLRSYTISMERRLFFLFWIIYFAGMFLLHVACLFDVGLYEKFVAGTGYFGVGALLFVTGISTIYFKMKKSHGRRKIKRQGNYGNY